MGSTGTFGQLVGQTFVLYGGLYLSAGTQFFPSPDHGSIDASAIYTVRVLTAGAEYSSASRTRYVVAVVPEPSTYALLVAGLMAMSGIARRRSKPRA